MGFKMARMEGTGRAKCKLCNSVITKGQPCIIASGYRQTGQCHERSKDCFDRVNRIPFDTCPDCKDHPSKRAYCLNKWHEEEE